MIFNKIVPGAVLVKDDIRRGGEIDMFVVQKVENETAYGNRYNSPDHCTLDYDYDLEYIKDWSSTFVELEYLGNYKSREMISVIFASSKN